jgi:hypothetical protein
VAAVIANPGEFASFAVGLTSIPGLVHAGVSAALGYDPVSGRTLEPWERTLPVVILAAIPAARLGLQTMRAGARLFGRSILGAVGALRRTGGAIGDFASASRAFGRLSGLDDAVRGIRVSTNAAHGSGPVHGVLTIGPKSRSSGAIRRYDPRPNPDYGGQRTVEFVYDPTTRQFAVGRAPAGPGSPHQRLARVVGADEEAVLGGTFRRGNDGRVMTDEFSGHYGSRWTDHTREDFIRFLEDATGQIIEHMPW